MLGRLLAVGVLLVASTLVAMPTGAPPARTPISVTVSSAAGLSWTNGLLRLGFANNSPAYTLESATNASVTVRQTLIGLAEVSAEGQIESFASFFQAGVNWSLTPTVGPTATSIVLAATVPVSASGGAWESGDDSNSSSTVIGNVSTQVRFAFNDSGGSAPGTLAYSLNITGWPWLDSTDSLGVEVRSNVSSTLGYWQATGSDAVTEISRTTQAPVASFVWGATAVAQYPRGGAESDSSVSAYRNFSRNDSNSLVRLSFGSVPGNYSSLSYDPWLEILAPGKVGSAVAAIILNPLSVSAIAVGTAVSLGLAYVARRRRTPPEAGL